MLYLMTQIWLQLVLAFALGGVAVWWWLAGDRDVSAKAEELEEKPRPEASQVESLRLQLESARSDARAAREALAARTRELRQLREGRDDDGVDGGREAPVAPPSRPSHAEAPRGRERPQGPRLPDALIEQADVDSSETDDLTRIRGVGPVLATLLNEMGIHTFREIAEWTAEDVDRVQSRLLRFPGRIRRDDWVGQAAELDRSAS